MANARISLVIQCHTPSPGSCSIPSGKAVAVGVWQPSGGMRKLAVRACLVDRDRKLVRQHFGDLIDRNIVLGGELPDDVAAQHLLDLIGRDRQVLSVPEPRTDLIAE